MVKLTI